MKTTFFVFFQSKHTAERKWEEVVQIQDPVRRAGKGSGNMTVYFAEYTVFPLSKPDSQLSVSAGLESAGFLKTEGDRVSADLKIAVPVACI